MWNMNPPVQRFGIMNVHLIIQGPQLNISDDDGHITLIDVCKEILSRGKYIAK